ncbi:hypothetical protein HPB50_019996 [Hyalomma asiaticum]|uniref:Uncharacterized protein n=1 Tax=Hyalomma asiaticum TaxID=266040 RepID=A0ACB7SRE2_HYAAI|nr:hypothetical protein HPB50_019996 [Hyalomma asiaticum]
MFQWCKPREGVEAAAGNENAVLKKKLTAQAKKSACHGLQEWVQPVVNHLYWCVAVSGGDGNLLVAIWKTLHQNENAGRVQATTQSGELKWTRKMLRAKKGEEVACTVKTKATYGYVNKLLQEMLDVCSSCSSFRGAERENESSTNGKPLTMIDLQQPRRCKADLVSARLSRFTFHNVAAPSKVEIKH